ncbi:MAG TPA: TldD/PmbA family protein [Candidatus Nanoarchaeia archaeon]|nr:TldD/PmbA family protein [Candidatus Nanoarchaeia archaeon]
MEIAYYVRDKLLKNKADDVLVKYGCAEASHVKFSNNQIVKTGSEVIENMGVFASFKGKLVFTNLKKMDKGSADELIGKILNFAKHTGVNKDYRRIAKGPFNYEKLDEGYDKKVIDLDCVDLVRKGINKALENAERCNGVFDKTVGKIFLVGSNNAEKEEEFTNLYFSLRAFYKDGSGHSNTCSRMLDKLLVEDSGEEAGTLAKESANPVDGVAGRCDVVLGTMPTIAFMNQFAEHASVANVEAGLSFLTGKLGKTIGKVTIGDYGNMPNGFNSAIFDEEGVPVKRNNIIENGVLKTYLHNTSTAIRHKTKTTGNAGLISPSAYNIVLEKGRADELRINEIKKGLYVSNIWYTRYQNYATGDFSTIPRDAAFVIENGEFKQAIKNIRISDNMLNILRNIEKVGKEHKQLRSWEADVPGYVPEMLVKNVGITRAEG